MSPSETYTAAAYLVVFLGVLGYVVIIASKLQRLQRQIGELLEKLQEPGIDSDEASVQPSLPTDHKNAESPTTIAEPLPAPAVESLPQRMID